MDFSFLMTPCEIQKNLAKRIQERRVFLNITQQDLAERSGVSLSSLKRIEKDGSGAIANLIKLAFVLQEGEAFVALFSPIPQKSILQLEPKKRQRSSRRNTNKQEYKND